MQRTKFFLGGALILAAVVYLIFSSTQASAEYFMTVNEVKDKGASVVGKSLRLSGAVLGDTIQYDSDTLTLTFDVAHVSGDNAEIEAQGGLAEVLYQAVNDPTRQRVTIQLCWRQARPAPRRGTGDHDRQTRRRRCFLRG